MKSKILTITLISFSLMVMVGGAYGEVSSRSGGDQDAAAKAQILLRQMATERDALQGQNAKLQDQLNTLQKDLDARNKEVDRMKKNLTSSGNDLNRSEEQNRAITDRLMQTRAKFQEVIDKFKDTIATLREVEMERNQLKATLGEKNHTLDDRSRELMSCIRKNIDLYQADLDMVKQYKDKGVWFALLQKEPVTGLKQVDIENAVEKYKMRLDQLREIPSAQQSSPK